MKIKKVFLQLAVISFALTRSAFAWDVVFDPTAVQQALAQVAQLVKQTEQMANNVKAVTGSYNVGAGTSAVKDILAGSWQDVVKNQTGTFGAKQAQYDKILQQLPKEGLDKLMGNNTQFSTNYNSVRMGMTVSDASYEALSEHMKNLSVLSAKINSTKNIKEAMDLGNQIAYENSMMIGINAKLAAAQTNLLSVQSSGGVSSSQKISAWNN